MGAFHKFMALCDIHSKQIVWEQQIDLFSAGCCNEKELALFHFAFLSFSKHWELQWVPPLADRYLRNLVFPKYLNGTCPNLSDCLKLSFTDVKEKYRMFRCGTLGVCVFADH